MASLIEEFDKNVWQSEVHDKPWHLRLPILAARLIVAIARDIRDGSLSLRATSLVYTTLLSLVPLLAICFSVIKGFGGTDQIEPFLYGLLEPLGQQGRDMVPHIMGFVDNINVGVLGTIGLALLVFSVLSLMQKVEDAFNQIWNVPNTRSLVLRIRDYLSVLLIGPLFIFLSIGMTASLKYQSFIARWLDVDLVNTALEQIFLVMPFVLFTLAFTVIYMFIPNTPVRLWPALCAGVVTAVAWKILGVLFGLFVAASGNYAAVYSAFAALILFMIWLYLAWLIVLISASITYYLQNPTNQRLSRHFRQLSLRVKTKLALVLLADIGQVFYQKDGKAMSAALLAKRMRVPARAIEDVAAGLLKANLLAQTEDGYIPGRPYEETTLAEAFFLLRAADETGGVAYGDLKPHAAADAVLDAQETVLHGSFSHITLKQLALGDMPGVEKPAA